MLYDDYILLLNFQRTNGCNARKRREMRKEIDAACSPLHVRRGWTMSKGRWEKKMNAIRCRPSILHRAVSSTPPLDFRCFLELERYHKYTLNYFGVHFLDAFYILYKCVFAFINKYIYHQMFAKMKIRKRQFNREKDRFLIYIYIKFYFYFCIYSILHLYCIHLHINFLIAYIDYS